MSRAEKSTVVTQTQREGASGQRSQISPYNSALQTTAVGNANEDFHGVTGGDFSDLLVRNEASICIAVSFAIGIALACCCLYIFKRRIDACADSICDQCSPRFDQELSRKGGDSSSRGTDIVYAQLNMAMLSEQTSGNSLDTPVKTHSEDLRQASLYLSADPRETRGSCTGVEQRRTESVEQVSSRHPSGDITAEGSSTYASLGQMSN